MQELQKLIGDLADYVDYRLMEGQRTEEIDPDVVKALSAPPTAAAPAPPASPQQTATAPATPATPASLPSATATGAVPVAGALLPETDETHRALNAIALQVAACNCCPLHSTRRHAVPGQGHAQPEVMFVGEAPGADEDAQGIAFVGRAGQLLTKMILAMGYTREQVFIGNILKCRPPDDRTPTLNEMEICVPYLKAQIKQLQPQVIVALGGTAAQSLLRTSEGITRLRGSWHAFEGIPVMPTYHPTHLLRYPATKKQAWHDLKAVLARLGRTPPSVS